MQPFDFSNRCICDAHRRCSGQAASGRTLLKEYPMYLRSVRSWMMTLLGAMLLAGCEAGDSGAPATAPSNTSNPRVLIAPATQPSDLAKINKSDAEWKQILTPNQYFILREKGTEPPFKNEYHD